MATKRRKSRGSKKRHEGHSEAEKADAGLDFPQSGEMITGPFYTFRIGMPQEAEDVEVSIDRGSWLPCRHSAGYW